MTQKYVAKGVLIDRGDPHLAEVFVIGPLRNPGQHAQVQRGVFQGADQKEKRVNLV